MKCHFLTETHLIVSKSQKLIFCQILIKTGKYDQNTPKLKFYEIHTNDRIKQVNTYLMHIINIIIQRMRYKSLQSSPVKEILKFENMPQVSSKCG